MTISVIYSECTGPFWVDVARNLAAELQWNPCYWISSRESEGAIRARFPDVVFHETLDAVRGIPPRECSEFRSAALDQQLLQDLSVHESVVLKMMDRMDPDGSFTYQQRIRLYHTQLGYWLAVLDHFKPDIVVFPIAPHVVYDYVLYALAQRSGVETVMFERTPIPGLMFPLKKFEEGSQVLRSRYQEKLETDSGRPVALSPTLQEYSRRVVGNYANAVPFYVQRYFEGSHPIQMTMFNRLLALRRYPHYVATLARNLSRSSRAHAPPNYLKQPGKNIEESDMAGVEWRRYKANANREKRRLNVYYHRLAKDIDLNRPYIYVALSAQPERTTSPLGGSFTHLLVMVDLLSKTIPDGWNLYVKEFPFQLGNMKYGQRSRSRAFYDDLVSLPNVRLVPLMEPPFPLIDHAKAVATVSGNTGWEAVNRGKPALIFGYAWYRDCEGVFYTPTQESCTEALSKIMAGYQVDREKVRLYAQVLEEICFRGYVEPSFKEAVGISVEENVEALTQALKRFWQAANAVQVAESA